MLEQHRRQCSETSQDPDFLAGVKNSMEGCRANLTGRGGILPELMGNGAGELERGLKVGIEKEVGTGRRQMRLDRRLLEDEGITS